MLAARLHFTCAANCGGGEKSYASQRMVQLQTDSHVVRGLSHFDADTRSSLLFGAGSAVKFSKREFKGNHAAAGGLTGTGNYCARNDAQLDKKSGASALKDQL
jgi:hypothetical protein